MAQASEMAWRGPYHVCCMAAQIHGNVCMRAVVVTPTLDWRLHGFDLLCEHAPQPAADWPLMAAAWMVGAQYKPAEARFPLRSSPHSGLVCACCRKPGRSCAMLLQLAGRS